MYHRYRPSTLSEVLGQEAITGLIQKQIDAGRIAHAYLFTGPRGTGKTSTARILARAMLSSGDELLTKKIAEDAATPDLLEIDAASHTSVENIRAVIEGAPTAPSQYAAKVYIIDEVHMLSKGAFNALLKTLEEPPSHVYFILATTEIHRVPETIISRCQRFDFKKITEATLVEALMAICKKESITAEHSGIEALAHAADGGFRDALSLLDQLAAFDEPITASSVAARLGRVDAAAIGAFLDALDARNIKVALEHIDAFAETGADVQSAITDATRMASARLRKAADANDMAKVSWYTAVIDALTSAFRVSGVSPVATTPLEIAASTLCAVSASPATTPPAAATAPQDLSSYLSKALQEAGIPGATLLGAELAIASTEKNILRLTTKNDFLREQLNDVALARLATSLSAMTGVSYSCVLSE